MSADTETEGNDPQKDQEQVGRHGSPGCHKRMTRLTRRDHRCRPELKEIPMPIKSCRERTALTAPTIEAKPITPRNNLKRVIYHGPQLGLAAADEPLWFMVVAGKP